MKKLFTIIAVASMMLTTVGFTSCQKDEMPNTQKTYINNNGNNGQSVTITSVNTQYENGSSTTGKKYAPGIQETVTETEKHISGTPANINVDYAVGTWKATVNGTEYKLVVSNSSSSDKYFKNFKATFYVGDKAYDGTFKSAFRTYFGQFSSDECDSDDIEKVSLSSMYISEYDLSQFKIDIEIEGNTIAESVTFVKL